MINTDIVIAIIIAAIPSLITCIYSAANFHKQNKREKEKENIKYAEQVIIAQQKDYENHKQELQINRNFIFEKQFEFSKEISLYINNIFSNTNLIVSTYLANKEQFTKIEIEKLQEYCKHIAIDLKKFNDFTFINLFYIDKKITDHFEKFASNISLYISNLSKIIKDFPSYETAKNSIEICKKHLAEAEKEQIKIIECLENNVKNNTEIH